MTPNRPRYQVLDETGVPLRAFWTREQAQRYLEPGYSLRVLERANHRRALQEFLASLEEAPF